MQNLVVVSVTVRAHVHGRSQNLGDAGATRPPRGAEAWLETRKVTQDHWN